jgi:hypothetical protein
MQYFERVLGYNSEDQKKTGVFHLAYASPELRQEDLKDRIRFDNNFSNLNTEAFIC